jgi:ABC-2 type transport system permease protein
LQITPGYLLVLLAYFLLGYLLFGAIMFGIGASVNAEQESRQIAGLISTLSLLPLMFSFIYFTDPNGFFAVFMSMFPLTSPVGMIIRASWTNVGPTDIALSLAILSVSVAGLIWLAARIFRLGLLNYGKRLSVRDIVRSLREGRHTLVIVPRKEASL